MTTDVVVTARSVEDLKCPFTGDRLEVHMIVSPGSVVFCAPRAFTLSEPVAGVDELFRRATMRNGVTGAVSRDGPKDPYTGARLCLREFPDGRVCFTGGFNPRAACDSLEEFVYRASQRDGATDVPVPSASAAEKVDRRRQPRHRQFDVSQETVEAAEAAVDKAGLVRKSVRGASFGGE